MERIGNGIVDKNISGEMAELWHEFNDALQAHKDKCNVCAFILVYGATSVNSCLQLENCCSNIVVRILLKKKVKLSQLHGAHGAQAFEPGSWYNGLGW